MCRLKTAEGDVVKGESSTYSDLHHLFAFTLCKRQLLHWNIIGDSEEQYDFSRLCRCFLPATLDEEVSEDGYVHRQGF